MDIKLYSEKALASIKDCNFLEEGEWTSLVEMHTELQDSYEKKQLWRTETEIRTSVLNDIQFPTKASKYWQAVREQSVFFENLATLSFEYKRNNIKIKKIIANIEKTEDELDKADLQIDLEEAMFSKKNMELSSKNRLRELEIWSKIKQELDDGSFDTVNVDSHQLVSYTQRYLLEVAAAVQMKANMSNSEARNLLGQTQTMLKRCEEQGKLGEVVKVLSIEVQELVLPQLGYNRQG